MGSGFRNAEELISHGIADLRRVALDIANHGLAAADPYEATKALISFDGRNLVVAERSYEIASDRRIFVVGAGKASFPIARALEELLGDRISGGLVVGKHGADAQLQRIPQHFAAHPVPDEASRLGALQTKELLDRVKPQDLVIACFTGGSSSLFVDPAGGISLQDKQETSHALLTCGAKITEINAVRKHISRVKGGRLALRMPAQAPLINLTVSDVIGDALDCITDPTVPDTSTLEDARATLDKYGLWSRVPGSVAAYLRKACEDQETPKPEDFADRATQSLVVLPADCACVGAAQRAETLGYDTIILSTTLKGESAEVGHAFAAIAEDVCHSGRPARPPCVVIGGGETTVRIDGPAGEGGPNQEFALSAAIRIDGLNDVAVLGIDSDGTDGPTDLAGGLVDGSVAGEARRMGLDLPGYLRAHDAGTALRQLSAAVVTGTTGTNVNDMKILVVGRP